MHVMHVLYNVHTRITSTIIDLDLVEDPTAGTPHSTSCALCVCSTQYAHENMPRQVARNGEGEGEAYRDRLCDHLAGTELGARVRESIVEGPGYLVLPGVRKRKHLHPSSAPA